MFISITNKKKVGQLIIKQNRQHMQKFKLEPLNIQLSGATTLQSDGIIQLYLKFLTD